MEGVVSTRISKPLPSLTSRKSIYLLPLGLAIVSDEFVHHASRVWEYSREESPTPTVQTKREFIGC